MRTITVTGIILKRQNFSDYHQFVTIYTPTLGQIEAVAKGVRKMGASLNGHVEILTIGTFQLYKGNKNYSLLQCQVLHNFQTIREDFDKLMIALLMLEIFQKTTHSLEHGEHAFNLLKESLQKLTNSNKQGLLLETYKIKLLHECGALPDFAHCSKCEKKIQENSKIFLNENHLTCEHCHHGNHDNEGSIYPLDFKMLKLLNYLQKAPLSSTEQLVLSTEHEQILKQTVNGYLQHYLPGNLKTELFFQKL